MSPSRISVSSRSPRSPPRSPSRSPSAAPRRRRPARKPRPPRWRSLRAAGARGADALHVALRQLPRRRRPGQERAAPRRTEGGALPLDPPPIATRTGKFVDRRRRRRLALTRCRRRPGSLTPTSTGHRRLTPRQRLDSRRSSPPSSRSRRRSRAEVGRASPPMRTRVSRRSGRIESFGESPSPGLVVVVRRGDADDLPLLRDHDRDLLQRSRAAALPCPIWRVPRSSADRRRRGHEGSTSAARAAARSPMESSVQR